MVLSWDGLLDSLIAPDNEVKYRSKEIEEYDNKHPNDFIVSWKLVAHNIDQSDNGKN